MRRQQIDESGLAKFVGKKKKQIWVWLGIEVAQNSLFFSRLLSSSWTTRATNNDQSQAGITQNGKGEEWVNGPAENWGKNKNGRRIGLDSMRLLCLK